MDALDTIEKMTLDLMVKGAIDTKSIKSSYEELRRQLRGIDGLEEPLGSIAEILATEADAKSFKALLQALEELRTAIASQARESDAIKLPKHLNYNRDTDERVVESFHLEVAEHLHSLENDLIVLERSPESGDVISNVMGHLHSIKGVAGFLDLEAVQRLAHVAESALAVDANAGKARPQCCDALFRVKDMIKSLSELLDVHFKRKARKFPPLSPTYPLVFNELLVLSGGAAATDTIQDIRDDVATAPPQAPLPDAPATPDSEPEDEDLDYEEFIEDSFSTAFGNLIVEAVETAASIDTDDEEDDIQSSPVEERAAEHIRIRMHQLDDLVELIGEIGIVHSQVLFTPSIKESEDLELRRKLAQMSKAVSSLQALGMKLRLFPVKDLFSPLTRTARDIAVRQNKKVDLEMAGEDAQLDKAVLNSLSDPLVHLVRNAIDHGLESPAERTAAGKPERGKLTLTARSVGGRVNITVADNGRGLDRERILAKATALGLVDGDGDSLTDDDVWRFLFTPGFSTAEEVTDISGRGVGLDVVNRRIERLGGTLDLDTKAGQGSTFSLSLPLTLAMIDGIVIRLADTHFIIPRLLVAEALRPRRDQVTSVHGQSEILNFRGNSMPIVRLSDFVQLKGHTVPPWEALLLVIENGASPFALLVDAVVGQQQVALKSLGEALAGQRGIAGCAILADGSVGLVLEPEEIESFLRDRAIKRATAAA